MIGVAADFEIDALAACALTAMVAMICFLPVSRLYLCRGRSFMMKQH